MHTILVLEDDIELNNTICCSLEKNGYRVMGARTCEEAKNYANSYTFHMAILDINLPDGNGFQFCKWLKARSNTLILFLSAKDLETDILNGYELGADDYVTKPFEPEEVLARIQAALRRVGKDTSARKNLVYKNIKLFTDSRKVTVAGSEIGLTAHEYDILYLLMQNPEKVYSREALYELVWHGGYYGENNTVNVHVSNLRKKLKEKDSGEEYIQTVYGIGFKLQ
mgnify:CR=1 FL=1